MKNLIYFFFPAMDILERGITGLLLLIDGLLYRFLSVLFKLFYSLAEVQLLDSTVYEKIADRVYLFVGIIALFGLSIGLLKALVNPDELNKGVIKSFKALITSIILLILMPTIFKYAYSFQHAIIADGVVEKIFQVDLGNNDNAGSMFETCSFDDDEVKHLEVRDFKGNLITEQVGINTNECQANYMIMTVMEAFITPASYDVKFTPSRSLTNLSPEGSSWEDAREYMIYTGNFNYVTNFVDEVHKPKSADQSISYIFIVSTIAAGIMIYVVLSFCIDLGVRTVKLAFYQVISPIPVLMKMIPGKEGQFDKWLKATISAFTEVFSRLIIISFLMFMIGNIFEIIDSMDGFDEVNLIGKAIIVIGLFTFAKQAPKLLSEALGFESGNVSLKIKDKLTSPPIIGKGFNAAYNGANKVRGAATGALGGLHTSLVNGAGTSGWKAGMIEGFKNGGSQYGKQRQAIYKSYGLEGKAGFLGGQNLIERKTNDIKKKAADAATESMRNTISNYENTNVKFKNTKNEQKEILRNKHADSYNQIMQKIAETSKTYDDEHARIVAMQQQAKTDYDNAQNRIKELNSALSSGGVYDGEDYISITPDQRRQMMQEIDQLRNTKYDSAHFENMIAENKIRRENDAQLDKLKEKLEEEAKYLETNSEMLANEAHAEARKIISKSDTYYGNLVSALAKKDSEKEVKEFKDSIEGQKAIAVQTQAYENFQKSQKSKEEKKDK